MKDPTAHGTHFPGEWRNPFCRTPDLQPTSLETPQPPGKFITTQGLPSHLPTVIKNILPYMEPSGFLPLLFIGPSASSVLVIMCASLSLVPYTGRAGITLPTQLTAFAAKYSIPFIMINRTPFPNIPNHHHSPWRAISFLNLRPGR